MVYHVHLWIFQRELFLGDSAQFMQTAGTPDCRVVPFGILKAFTKAAAQGLFSLHISHYETNGFRTIIWILCVGLLYKNQLLV